MVYRHDRYQYCGTQFIKYICLKIALLFVPMQGSSITVRSMRRLDEDCGIEEDVIASLSNEQITRVNHLLKRESQELKVPEKSLTAISVALGARRRILGIPEANKYISTGIVGLDTALGGGLLRGGLTEFCGLGVSILACCALETAASLSTTQVVVGGGSGIHLMHGSKSRLVIPNVWDVTECVNAIRRDELALRTLGRPQTEIVLIDGVTRQLDASLGTGGPYSRARVRAETSHIATGLRELALDTNCAVLVVSPSPATGIRRMWEQVLDARVDVSVICVEKGNQDEYNRESNSVSRKKYGHVSARVTRKDGVSKDVLLNLAASFNR